MSDWNAQVIIEARGNFRHCRVYVAGAPDAGTARDAAKEIADALKYSGAKYVRATPEGVCNTDFETRETQTKGCARFSFDLDGEDGSGPVSITAPADVYGFGSV